MSLNLCQFIGNLGKDPEIRTLTSGDRVANLRLAVSETWKDKSTGERKERVEWIAATIFNEPLVKLCENYLRKGSKIYISGAMQTRKWTDQSGVEKYSTEIVLKAFNGQIEMLDAKGGGGGQEGEIEERPRATGPKESFDLDSEIPFVRGDGLR